jgi:very-short-patch-repair endonuclease
LSPPFDLGKLAFLSDLREGDDRRMRPLRSRTQVARRLRREATDAERQLWRALRELVPEFGFRRQHPIGSYIADFASPSQKLAIELDGGQHAQQQLADAARTEDLVRYGYRVIRFWNNDVVQNLAGVIDSIRRELDS